MKDKSIVESFIFYLIKTISTILFPIITFTYSARILGVEGVGKVNFAKSVISYFTMLAMLGMNYYGTREVAKLRNNRNELSKFVKEMLVINGLATICSFLLLGLAISNSSKLQGYQSLLYINSVSIFLQGMGMEWLYQGLEEYKYVAVRSVVFQIIALLLMVVFVKSPDDVIWYVSIWIFATSGVYILNFFNAINFINFKIKRKYEFKKHIKPLLWLFAMAVSIELYTVLDTTMLGFLKGDVAVGKYTAAIKMCRLANTLITSLGVVLIPRISYYVGCKQKEKIECIVCKSYNFVFMLSIPAMIGLYCLCQEIILLFSGKEFLEATTTMRILAPIVILIPFSVVTNQQTFIPMGKEKWILISTCIGAVINLTCNVIFIPIFAENGAAIGTVVAETSVAIVSYINASRFIRIKSIFKGYYQYWLAAFPIFCITFIIKMLEWNFVLEMIIIMGFSVVSYVGILYLFKNEYLIYAIQMILKKIHRK